MLREKNNKRNILIITGLLALGLVSILLVYSLSLCGINDDSRVIPGLFEDEDSTKEISNFKVLLSKDELKRILDETPENISPKEVINALVNKGYKIEGLNAFEVLIKTNKKLLLSLLLPLCSILIIILLYTFYIYRYRKVAKTQLKYNAESTKKTIQTDNQKKNSKKVKIANIIINKSQAETLSNTLYFISTVFFLSSLGVFVYIEDASSRFFNRSFIGIVCLLTFFMSIGIACVGMGNFVSKAEEIKEEFDAEGNEK